LGPQTSKFLQELDLVFRSAMQSGVVAAEEGEMIASVRNLDSKKIKARCGSLQIEPATTLPPLPPYQCPANGLPGDHDAIGGHDLYRISGAHCEASSSHQGDSVPRIRWDPVGSGVDGRCWLLCFRCSYAVAML
jgi:hypothetical protein